MRVRKMYMVVVDAESLNEINRQGIDNVVVAEAEVVNEKIESVYFIGSERTLEHGVFARTDSGRHIKFRFKEWWG